MSLSAGTQAVEEVNTVVDEVLEDQDLFFSIKTDGITYGIAVEFPFLVDSENRTVFENSDEEIPILEEIKFSLQDLVRKLNMIIGSL